VYKKTSRKIWEQLEKFLFPRLKNVVTVNDSIKNVYEKKYKVPVVVVRNVPYRSVNNENFRADLPKDKKILVMQGIGLNENRGAEEAILMMQFLGNDYALYFIGGGTILQKLKRMVVDLELSAKVTFIDVMPYNQMMAYTKQCFLGLIFEKINFNDEHMFALPNKFFDYLKAGIPVLSSKAVEIKNIIEKYNVGAFIENFEPDEIAEKILEITKNNELYQQWKLNTVVVANELCWENEEIKLKDFIRQLS
jgi:glycosyltransferase involved in cell wall biosynthesis